MQSAVSRTLSLNKHLFASQYAILILPTPQIASLPLTIALMGCTPCQGQVILKPCTKGPSLNDPIYSLIALNSSRLPYKAESVQVREGDLQDYYQLEGVIGQGDPYSGATGTVYRATHIALGQKRAIKSVSRTYTGTQEGQLLREISALHTLVSFTQNHPNILKLYEVIRRQDCYHLVTELLSGGDLLSEVLSGKRRDEEAIASLMQQVIAAVAYCHGLGVIHRDIKLENLVLENESEAAVLKLIDFGTSCRLAENPKGVKGTDFYMAPEVVLGHCYNEKCDIWSCGVVLYILLCGYPPFNGKSTESIHRRILEQSLRFPCKCYLDSEWRTVSPEAKDLIRRMLDRDPVLRPAASLLLSHAWFKPRIAGKAPASSSSTDQQTASFPSESALLASQPISPVQLARLREAFRALDLDQDGKLTQSEVIKGLVRSGDSTAGEDAKSVLQSGDNSGYIGFTEFVAAAASWPRELVLKLEGKVTKKRDMNGDEGFSLPELRLRTSYREGRAGERDFLAQEVAADTNHEACCSLITNSLSGIST